MLLFSLTTPDYWHVQANTLLAIFSRIYDALLHIWGDYLAGKYLKNWFNYLFVVNILNKRFRFMLKQLFLLYLKAFPSLSVKINVFCLSKHVSLTHSHVSTPLDDKKLKFSADVFIIIIFSYLSQFPNSLDCVRKIF